MKFTNWKSGEPNHLKGENCVDVDKEGFWNDKDCNTETYFVCEHFHKSEIKLENPVLKQDQVVGTLPVIGPTFVVKLKLTVNSLPLAPLANIFHVTKGTNSDSGSRYPALWLTNEGALHFESERNGKFNASNDFLDLELKKLHEIQMTQSPKDGKMVFEIVIDGKIIVSEENADPITFEEAKIYLSDPWYPSAPVELKNFFISTIEMQ